MNAPEHVSAAWNRSWNRAALLQTSVEALEHEAARIAAEQRVAGLDALSEVEVHPLLAAAFERAGWGVVREALYPHQQRAGRRGAQEKKASDAPTQEVESADDQGSGTRSGTESGTESGRGSDSAAGASKRDFPRCDLVLTPARGVVLSDARSPTDIVHRAGSLFEGMDATPASQKAPATACYWLEVKVVAQFCYTLGVPGPNRTYASELRHAVRTDLRKLAAQRDIGPCALLLILFAADDSIASHDSAVALHDALRGGMELDACERGWCAIQDRIGNRVCHVTLASPARAADR